MRTFTALDEIDDCDDKKALTAMDADPKFFPGDIAAVLAVKGEDFSEPMSAEEVVKQLTALGLLDALDAAGSGVRATKLLGH